MKIICPYLYLCYILIAIQFLTLLNLLGMFFWCKLLKVGPLDPLDLPLNFHNFVYNYSTTAYVRTCCDTSILSFCNLCFMTDMVLVAITWMEIHSFWGLIKIFNVNNRLHHWLDTVVKSIFIWFSTHIRKHTDRQI